jgi:hypothetical protein
MQTPNSPTRRWFRFSLRTLLVAITLFGLWLGYYINWIHQRQQARAVEDREAVEIQDNVEIVKAVMGVKTVVQVPPPHSFSWVLAILGERPVNGVLLSGSEKDPKQKALAESYRKLFPESDVGCRDDFPPDPEELANIPIRLPNGEVTTMKRSAEQEAKAVKED